MESTALLDEELAENLALAANVSRCVVLAGRRQFDRFLLRGQRDYPRPVTLERLCHESLEALATWTYDPGRRRLKLAWAAAHRGIPQGDLPGDVGYEQSFEFVKLLDAYSSISLSNDTDRYVLVVDAALLFEDANLPRDDDFRALQAVERFARTPESGRFLILRTARTTDLPQAVVRSPHIRVIHIPEASRDVRHAYALSRIQGLAERCGLETEAAARAVSDATEDWTLEQIDALLCTAERQGTAQPHDIEELARALRIGSTHSPWAGERIRYAISGAREALTRRVLGQPGAIDAVVNSLRQAAVGLSSAHQSQNSQAPRAIFFFAGPTGTGKTELAKSISQLIFGQEQLLRFDCGELRQEHAVARLIGAPPGYIGYARGGELTEGIRAKPNSVVLFDEIEKAHPRLLDTLLGVLDDGRLTSGQGETLFFGQAVVIFTSNLGMYKEVKDPEGRVVTRRPRFTYDTPFSTIEAEVREAIQQEFVTNLGRPELLGRLGGPESIIVFDYLRDLSSVCRKFLRNIVDACERLHNVTVCIDDSIIEHIVNETNSSPDALLLGGRGLVPALNHWVTNPIADYLFDATGGSCAIQISVKNGQTLIAPTKPKG